MLCNYKRQHDLCGFQVLCLPNVCLSGSLENVDRLDTIFTNFVTKSSSNFKVIHTMGITYAQY